ncbi:MAG: SURF1 family protein [Gammaproteobacteria bacterium]|nr:SURF1 family protein [Gammaproteobacteria bacterium]MCP5200541.1 SURF1 family protein [Gammaproteobacteria bacterium]
MSRATNSTLRTVMTVATFVLGFALLCSLGLWQLSRAAEKQARYAAFVARLEAPAVNVDDLDTADPAASHAWQRVRLRGHYRDLHVLLDNRVQAGRVGYDVLSPFVTEGGRTVLIDRGWIPLEGSRETVPDLVAPADPFTLSGFIGEPPVVGVELNAAAATAEWLAPRIVRVQRVEPAGIGELFGLETWPAVVYLDADAPGALAVDWPVPGDGSARHRAYAVQWFAMAAVLATIGIALAYRKRSTQT